MKLIKSFEILKKNNNMIHLENDDLVVLELDEDSIRHDLVEEVSTLET